MKKPFWLLLLEEWNVRGGRGLTLPYIIGAYRLVDSQTYEKLNLKDLLKEILNNQINITIVVTYCNNIGTYLLELVPQDEIKLHEYTHKLKNEIGHTTLLFPKKGLGDTYNELVENLDNLAKPAIDKEQYSVRQKEWKTFNSSDVDFILKTLTGKVN